MRASCVLLAALVALAAYYVYIPLPGSVSDPWKLMLLDATFRGAQQVVRRSRALLLPAPGERVVGPNRLPGAARVWSAAERSLKAAPLDVAGCRVRVLLAGAELGLCRPACERDGRGQVLSRTDSARLASALRLPLPGFAVPGARSFIIV